VTNDLALALRYLGARYPLDDRERMRRDTGQDPPRFALARTQHGCVWRFRSDLAPAETRALAKYAAREAAIESPASAPLPERLEPMRRVLHVAGDEVRVSRLLLYCPRDGAATGHPPENTADLGPASRSGNPGALPPDRGSAPREGWAFHEYGGHGAVDWGDGAAIAGIETRSFRIYGDLLLMR